MTRPKPTGEDTRPPFADVRESVEFNRSRLDGTLPHHPDLVLLPTHDLLPGPGQLTSSSRVALNHANANDRHVAWSEDLAAADLQLPSRPFTALPDSSEPVGRPGSPRSRTPSPIMKSSPGLMRLPSPPTDLPDLDIHWTQICPNLPPPMQPQPPPQHLTTCYAYTNDKYRSPQQQRKVSFQTNEPIQGLDVPHPGEELTPLNFEGGGMTLVPGLDKMVISHLDIKKGTEEEQLQREGGDGQIQQQQQDQQQGYDYVGAAAADDTDEELWEPTPLVCLPIVLDDVPVPTEALLTQKLPSELHPFLAKSCKKDCRMWLWKNAIGRGARDVLAKKSKDREADRGIPISPTESVLSGNANKGVPS